MSSIIRISFAVCLFFCSFSSSAWWSVGHELVAKIAYDQLKPAVKKRVNKLVKRLAKDYPEMKEFKDLSPWPDNLRKQKIEAFTHWHYIDMAYSADGTPQKKLMDTDNSVAAMTYIEPIIQNAGTNPAEKARFLAFLVHIVGDIHQPLHNITRISKEHPDGDKGGNLFFIRDPNNQATQINLHLLWDSNFGQFDDAKNPDINEMAHEITAHFPPDYFGEKVFDLSPKHWSVEGFNLGKNFVYHTRENQVPNVNYQIEAKKLIQERVALGGYRLANLLNHLLE